MRQIGRIFDYLQDFNPQAATEVAQQLIKTGDSLATFSHRGRLVENTDMRELVTSYPYVIRYRVSHEEVYILRVRHTARKPA